MSIILCHCHLPLVWIPFSDFQMSFLFIVQTEMEALLFLQVSMTLNISGDLQSLFTWNTKQVLHFNCIFPLSFFDLFRDKGRMETNFGFTSFLCFQVFVFLAAEYDTPKKPLNQVWCMLWLDCLQLHLKYKHLNLKLANSFL